MTSEPNPAANPPPPVLRGQAFSNDVEHLRLLAIFHFVDAGLALLALMALAVHFTLFHAITNNPQMWQNNRPGPSPAAFFEIFQVFYLIGAMWFILSGVLNVISGFCLRARTNRTFSLVVAGFNCLHLPLGTALGVFTFIVLTRNSVRELYGE